MMHRFIFLSVLVFVLTGCTHSPPTCPGPSGLSCQPLHAVEQQLDRKAKQSTPFVTGLVGMRPPTRQKPHVLTVWLAPFEDGQGNYHGAHNVYMALGEGHWQSHPIYRRAAHG